MKRLSRHSSRLVKYKNISRNSAGYSIVEIMIFLSVSAAIFFASMGLLSGQQGKTEFKQAVSDFSSKIQNSINEVKTGYYPNGGGNFSCIVPNGANSRATITGTNSELGGNEDCIYLGKSIHLAEDSSSVYIYTVLGNRTVQNGSVRIPATSFDDTKPEPIFGGGPVDLTEEYTIQSQAQVISSKVTEITSNSIYDNYFLTGFYSSLQETTVTNSGGSITDASQSLLSKGYNTTASPRSAVIKNCINQDVSCVNRKIKRWEICVQSGSSNETALITISSTVGGVTSDLEFKACT